MSEKQPPTVVEGATAGDVEEEVQPAKSAEDRKAASALASLDAGGDDSGSGQVDVDAAQKAIKGLGGATAAKKEVKNVKVDAADVALLVDELELTKPKATELLKANDGDASPLVLGMMSSILTHFGSHKSVSSPIHIGLRPGIPRPGGPVWFPPYPGPRPRYGGGGGRSYPGSVPLPGPPSGGGPAPLIPPAPLPAPDELSFPSNPRPEPPHPVRPLSTRSLQLRRLPSLEIIPSPLDTEPNLEQHPADSAHDLLNRRAPDIPRLPVNLARILQKRDEKHVALPTQLVQPLPHRRHIPPVAAIAIAAAEPGTLLHNHQMPSRPLHNLPHGTHPLHPATPPLAHKRIPQHHLRLPPHPRRRLRRHILQMMHPPPPPKLRQRLTPIANTLPITPIPFRSEIQPRPLLLRNGPPEPIRVPARDPAPQHPCPRLPFALPEPIGPVVPRRGGEPPPTLRCGGSGYTDVGTPSSSRTLPPAFFTSPPVSSLPVLFSPSSSSSSSFLNCGAVTFPLPTNLKLPPPPKSHQIISNPVFILTTPSNPHPGPRSPLSSNQSQSPMALSYSGSNPRHGPPPSLPGPDTLPYKCNIWVSSWPSPISAADSPSK
ncbi:hypothetical protein CNYM01_11367 [Colletotrichum nymphaeae SA-01]|uniref:Nascent polypeptide-associated complex subunit alpha-like UBA domain-containing protein n=1 Tax=Colletotrichum nymphaeae SA-01 TaxID=1460502 RepID=A0A135UXD1_9PEZI|nr:hypothetical protein CNYM01_11367 [Colletotrichum nymphaeae SA-01]